MDEATEPWGATPSATAASKSPDRYPIRQRAAVVCAVYDFYRSLMGIDFTNITREDEYLPFTTLTQSTARAALVGAGELIAERVGEYVLFAPLSLFCKPDEAIKAKQEGDNILFPPLRKHRSADCPYTVLYTRNHDEDKELQKAWTRFRQLTGLQDCGRKQFYTAKTFPHEGNYNTVYTCTTHCSSNEAGWHVFLHFSLAALGPDDEHDDAKPFINEFQDMKPGDLIGIACGGTQLYGLGVILSPCHICNPKDCKIGEGKFYHAGVEDNVHRFYPFHLDVAWILGDDRRSRIQRGTPGLGLPNKTGWTLNGLFRAGIHPCLYNYLLHTTPTTFSPMTEDLKKQLEICHNLILTGPPGTGKTYLATQVAEAMEAEHKMVQFHPSYDYTDFVEGLRPTKPTDNGSIGFERLDGTFKAFCKQAWEHKDKVTPHVFIIDEINRGELSRIFGELFYCLDPDYRMPCSDTPGQKKPKPVKTQYQQLINDKENDVFKDGFFVPDNVYIIGTMNDIDRSVESMDFAIRRRFTWREVEASRTAEEIIDAKVPKKLRGDAKAKIAALNLRIRDDKQLGSAYEIGGAYFAKLAKLQQLMPNDTTADKLWDALWDYHLKGLLHEYLRGRSDATTVLAELKSAYDSAKPE